MINDRGELGVQVSVEGNLLSDGFAQIPNAIIRSTKLTVDDKALFALLLSRGVYSYPSMRSIGADLGISANRLIKATKRLVDLGLLRKRRRGLGMANTYTILQAGVDQFVGGEAELTYRELQNSRIVNSGVHVSCNKEYQQEEYQQEKYTQHTQNRGNGIIWPEWYHDLRSLPGFNVPFAEAHQWLDGHNYSEAHASEVAAALVSKWDNLKYSNAWATFRAWMRRPRLGNGFAATAPQTPDPRAKFREAVAAQEANAKREE
jgi:DNA-binding transcriptional regulator YhcF (GntR family)